MESEAQGGGAGLGNLGAAGGGGLGSLGTPGGGGLGSLVQSARAKHIKEARGALIIVGVLTLILNAISLGTIRTQIQGALRQQVATLGPGQVVDQEKLQAIEDQLVKTNTVELIGWISLGVVFVALGLMTRRFPVPATLLGLVLYLGATAIMVLRVWEGGDAQNSGLLIRAIGYRIFMIIALVKAVQSAIAYQRETKEAAALGESVA